MTHRFGWLVLLAGLSACAGKPVAVAVAPPAMVVPPPPPPAPTPINAGLTPAATLWHLRVGLNVAALACRDAGEAARVARYNALLTAHASALAAAASAYEAQYQAAGEGWRARYDDDQTRLYNFFGQPRGREALCAAADETLAALGAGDDAVLAAAAGDRLAALDRALAPPRLEVDARVFTGPTTVMMAMR